MPPMASSPSSALSSPSSASPLLPNKSYKALYEVTDDSTSEAEISKTSSLKNDYLSGQDPLSVSETHVYLTGVFRAFTPVRMVKVSVSTTNTTTTTSSSLHRYNQSTSAVAERKARAERMERAERAEFEERQERAARAQRAEQAERDAYLARRERAERYMYQHHDCEQHRKI
jgi:hypothetical protein